MIIDMSDIYQVASYEEYNAGLRNVHTFTDVRGEKEVYVCSTRELDYMHASYKLSTNKNVRMPYRIIDGKGYTSTSTDTDVLLKYGSSFQSPLMVEGALRILNNHHYDRCVFFIKYHQPTIAEQSDMSLMIGVFQTIYDMHEQGLVHGMTMSHRLSVVVDTQAKHHDVMYSMNGKRYKVKYAGTRVCLTYFARCRDMNNTNTTLLEAQLLVPPTNIKEKLMLADYMGLMRSISIFNKAYALTYEYVWSDDPNQKPFDRDIIFSVFNDFLES